ncbi:TetR/AcrR family transcriptional regulator [Sporichthya sp.]|uniref:TetR/AcrR family transcriptional regulator n=1 Tax=Sporichthya sp. TaxID=65475 RepID=UPI00183A0228|nr:TetR/AcrR family transcriptional regulator [Sporichthya sp.]MBA3743887.1 TetR/AcrR family transcriptional regulator [Sporichthya sp.]
MDAEAVALVAPRAGNARGRRTRAQLVEAATGCFAEYGYERTRIADIVSRAGVSQGNFYRHFESKKEIFLEALRPGLDALLEARAELRDHTDADALAADTAIYLRTYSRHRHILRVMREAAAVRSDGFDEMWLTLRQGFVDRTQAWLERLHAAGRIGEADFPQLAAVLGAMIEQVAYVQIGLPDRAPRDEEIQRIARTIGEVWHRALPPATPSPADLPK